MGAVNCPEPRRRGHGFASMVGCPKFDFHTGPWSASPKPTRRPKPPRTALPRASTRYRTGPLGALRMREHGPSTPRSPGRRPTRPRQTHHGPTTTHPLEWRGPRLSGLPLSRRAGRQGHSSPRRSRRATVSMTASARWRERWERLNIVDQGLCPVRRRRGVVPRTASARWRRDFAQTSSLFGTARPAGRRRNEGRRTRGQRAPGRT